MKTVEEIYKEVISEQSYILDPMAAIKEISKRYAKQFLDAVHMKVMYERAPEMNYEPTKLNVWETADDCTVHLNVMELKNQIDKQ